MTALAPLHAYRQFIVVKLVPLPNGKTDKLPMNPYSGTVTEKGSDGAHNPLIWLSHDEALALATSWGPQFTVGFVLTEADPFWCLDIDGARGPDGGWSSLATTLCASLPGTAVEVSQSGQGLHIWGQGTVPPHAAKNVPLHIELYTERRFIALGTGAVGDMTQPCPAIAQIAAAYFPPRVAVAAASEGPCAEWRGPTDDDELLRRAMRSQSAGAVFGGARATFADLWHADEAALAAAYPPDDNSSEPFDRSSADMALASHLAFWTGRDAARIERLMRRSKLAREKWDTRDDYLVERTIGGACGMCRSVLQDKLPEPSPLPAVAAPATAAAPAASPTPAPAPSAPEMRAVEGSTFLGPAEQAALFRGCVYVSDVHKVLVPGGSLLNPDRFKATFGGYSFAMDARNERVSRNAFEAFTESQVLRAPRADGTCFRPDLPYGAIVTTGGRTRANTWWPIDVPCIEGDVGPFLTHLRNLLPNDRDRLMMLSYLACIVQFPGRKFQCCPLVVGVEGNGKTFLSLAAAEAVGARYVHWPKASKIAKQFNAWMVGRVLYAVEDIYTNDNTDVVEELKPMITGGHGLEIEKKGVDQVSEEVVGNFILNSNHKNGLPKTRNDRRFMVFYCPQQQTEDLTRDGITPDYMARLYRWARGGGFAHITHYLRSFAIPDEFRFDQGIRAPETSVHNEAIEAGRGRLEQEVQEAIDADEPGFAGGWVSSIALDRLLERKTRTGLAPNKRRELLQALGYDWHPALVPARGRVNNIVLPDGGKPRLFIKRGDPQAAIVSPAEVAKAYTAAQGVGLK